MEYTLLEQKKVSVSLLRDNDPILSAKKEKSDFLKSLQETKHQFQNGQYTVYKKGAFLEELKAGYLSIRQIMLH